jgi:outer membrane immunogenic protein
VATNPVSDPAAASFDTYRSGFVVGGGLEWLMAQNWTARAEYLFYNFSNNSNGSGFIFPSGINVLAKERDINVFRLGASYKF